MSHCLSCSPSEPPRSYLSGQASAEHPLSLLRPKYNIVAFLERMLAAGEGRPPLYSSNFVLPWSLCVDCSPSCCVSGEKLFDYILTHEHVYCLRTLAMLGADGKEEFCLIEKEVSSESFLFQKMIVCCCQKLTIPGHFHMFLND